MTLVGRKEKSFSSVRLAELGRGCQPGATPAQGNYSLELKDSRNGESHIAEHLDPAVPEVRTYPWTFQFLKLTDYSAPDDLAQV